MVTNHIDTIIRSRRMDFGEVLGGLTGDELNAICEALGLVIKGRVKHVLINRILGEERPVVERERGKTRSERERPTYKPRGNNGRDQYAVEVDNGQKLTRERLEKHLRSAADILRVSIDRSDHKNFIYGLLFLKRLSNRFQEECEVLIEETADSDYRNEHQFYSPPCARWSEIQKKASNPGKIAPTRRPRVPYLVRQGAHEPEGEEECLINVLYKQ